MMCCVCWHGITLDLRQSAKAGCGSTPLSLFFPTSLVWHVDKRSPGRMRNPAALQSPADWYAWRLGEVLPHRDIAILRGIEGARVKELYRITADQMGVKWTGRRYDRQNPAAADMPNQAINNAASAVEGVAAIAVAATATIPQLGFIHEDSSQSFLDIADLIRDTVTVPCAFKATQIAQKRPGESIERVTRRIVAERLRRDSVIPTLIERIKALFSEETKTDADDRGDHS
jgi:CRISPR-associated protein Cas1